MLLRGKLYAESPIYRGNARKTLFTRDHDGRDRLVSLAGEVRGTAQALMDAFIGSDKQGKNRGLLNRLWERLYDAPLPNGLIRAVDCQLEKTSYPRDRFFDLRMGIKLDEDRWAAEANANYKYETLFRNAVFDFQMGVDDNILKQGDNAAKLYYVLQELREGRFWFGAGKSKGLGRIRLEIELPFGPPATLPEIHPEANHLSITLTFDAANPVLVGWNWGKVDPEVSSFAAVEGRLLIGAMRGMPVALQERLALALGGPILSPQDWKKKFADYLPRAMAIWLREQSLGQTEAWSLEESALAKLTKGKYGLSAKVIAAVEPLIDRPFSSQKALETALIEALADKANMAYRILATAKRTTAIAHTLNEDAWSEAAAFLGYSGAIPNQIAESLANEAALTAALVSLCQAALPRLYEQVDQQIALLQSDAWVDVELANREEHLLIKQMLRDGKISEQDWNNWNRPPEGVSAGGWREFLAEHRRVRFHHMRDARNLNKSIANDQNFIAFLKSYRDKTRQELAQPYHIDFRAGGIGNREISKKFGKAYDTVFMRMLSWTLSPQGDGTWEIYIPGSTLKGAFRKRATQIIKTLWGEGERATRLLEWLFGAQGQIGMAYFSDAYLMNPYDPNSAWCSMDGVKMNLSTGAPVESAKADYLFAYGHHLVFQMRIDVQDVTQDDLEALSLLAHLIQDFQRGDIVLGGSKTVGFGWTTATVSRLEWRAGSAAPISAQLFLEQSPEPNGIWQTVSLSETAATAVISSLAHPIVTGKQTATEPPRATGGFISHRAFGGHCGMLVVEAEVLTPLTIRESGEPSYRVITEEGHINGWDFFSMSPPENAYRSDQREYALPSKSIKGMLRHIYAIASDSQNESPNIENLNPVDSLFGFVGKGPNQALMGRLAIDFGFFENPQLAWFRVPYPYGDWKFDGEWKEAPGSGARKYRIANIWRVFPHAPLAPIVQQLDDFQPDTAQAAYFRAALPGSRARFDIRFWNLTDEELQRLVWCLELEEGLAHKMGGGRYLGFGSVRLHIRPESYLIAWADRYAGKSPAEWKRPFQSADWRNPEVVFHRRALQQMLNAEPL